MFKRGNKANPKGCPKGAHHIGRPKDEIKEECYKLATNAAPLIIARFIKISLGENTEQVVTDKGEILAVPAPAPTQIKAGEVVLKYGLPIIENPQTPADSVRNVETAMKVLKLLQEVSRNGNLLEVNRRSLPAGMGDGRPSTQALTTAT